MDDYGVAILLYSFY